MENDYAARKVRINGIVQGVGFRPFVYQTAVRHGLSGHVANTSTGVDIHIEGASPRIDLFLTELAENPPPLAHIIDVRVKPTDIAGADQFTIHGEGIGSSQKNIRG